MSPPKVIFPLEMSAAMAAELEATAARYEIDAASLTRIILRQTLDRMNAGNPVIELPTAVAQATSAQYIFGNQIGGDLDGQQKAAHR